MDDLKKLLENAGMGESVDDWAAEQPTNYEAQDDSGHTYQIIFHDQNGGEMMTVEANGRGIAWAMIGGAGFTDAHILDKNQLMDALFAFADETR